MGLFTEFFHMFKPSKSDPAAIAKINEDLDTIDYEMHRPPLTVNGIAPGQDRNLSLTEVPLAGNLSSDIAQIVTGAFIQRVSGGGASIEDGGAFLSTIKGNAVHTGQVTESINMTVNAAQREEGVDPITATLDRDTFVAYVQASGTITLTYTTTWNASPALYGITVNGTPVSGDEIVVVYVKANRGLITVCNPTSFNATGWNLFNRAVGYARVCKYSDTYGFKIGGTYSLVEFSTTVSGTRSTLTLEDGYFNVPSDGFVFVTGSDATTYIYATFTDWTEGYQGDFEAYSVDTIDLTEVMLAFPYGLCAVGNVRDEINLNTQTAIKRIERFGYSAENLAAVIASGVDYDADESYIYAVTQTPNTSAVSVNGDYSVSDHGIEYFIGSAIPVYTEVLYGENLKDKLRTDVLTISAQSLTDAQKLQVQKNIGADRALVNRTITTPTDLNTLTSTDGGDTFFDGNDVTLLSNRPEQLTTQGHPFLLSITHMGFYTMQTLHVYTIASRIPTIFYRQQTYSNGSVVWMEWYQAELTKELYKQYISTNAPPQNVFPLDYDTTKSPLVEIIRNGRTGFITFRGVGRTHVEEEVLITELPAEFRPIMGMYFVITLGSAGSCIGQITTTGRVTVWSLNTTLGANVTRATFNIVYPINH